MLIYAELIINHQPYRTTSETICKYNVIVSCIYYICEMPILSKKAAFRSFAEFSN